MGRPASCTCGDCAKCAKNAKQRDRYRQDPERGRASSNASRARRIESVREYDRNRGFRVYDETKKKARLAVTHAIEKGRLKRKPCEKCGDPKAHAHHFDYTKPLEVVWLCSVHHGEVHRQYPSTVTAKRAA